MNVIEAINKRKALRKYSQTPLELTTLEEIEKLSKTVERLYPEIDIRIHIVKDGMRMQELMPGIIGAYGKVKAPHYIVVTSNPQEGYMENAGYTLENLVLKLTAIGIGTCWIGGSVKEGLFNKIIDMPKGHTPVIIIAFGYPENAEDIFREKPSDAKRKPLSELVSGEMDETMGSILEAARLAPSAVNLQPWRFFLEGNTIKLYTAKALALLGNHLEMMRKIDAGICLSHIKLAGEYYGKSVKIKKEKAPEIKKHIYITTITVK